MCYIPVHSLLYCGVLNSVAAGVLLLFSSKCTSWSSTANHQRWDHRSWYIIQSWMNFVITRLYINAGPWIIFQPTLVVSLIPTVFAAADISSFDLQTESFVHSNGEKISIQASTTAATCALRTDLTKVVKVVHHPMQSIAEKEAIDVGSTILELWDFSQVCSAKRGLLAWYGNE